MRPLGRPKLFLKFSNRECSSIPCLMPLLKLLDVGLLFADGCAIFLSLSGFDFILIRPFECHFSLFVSAECDIHWSSESQISTYNNTLKLNFPALAN